MKDTRIRLASCPAISLDQNESKETPTHLGRSRSIKNGQQRVKSQLEPRRRLDELRESEGTLATWESVGPGQELVDCHSG